MNNKSKLLILLFTWTLVSCATVRLEEEDVSLTDIKQSIKSMVGEFRVVSQNQREVSSPYFSRKKDPKFDPEKSLERSYAHFTILGDRRPYDITVEVFVEKRQDGVYEQVETDEKVAEILASELKIRLHQGLENRNVIDSFRAF